MRRILMALSLVLLAQPAQANQADGKASLPRHSIAAYHLDGDYGSVNCSNDTCSIEDTGQVSEFFAAWSLNADGTQCAAPTAVTLNSGPIVGSIVCADNAASAFYGDMGLPDNYDGGTITVKLHAHRATGSGTLTFNFSAQCRGADEVPSSTWGSAVAVSITFDLANELEQVESAAITPAGTCAAGDHLFFRAVMNATATDVADANIVGVSVGFAVSDLDEVD